MESFSVCGSGVFYNHKTIKNRHILTCNISKHFHKDSTSKKSKNSNLIRNRRGIFKCSNGKNFAWPRLALNDINTSKIPSNENEGVGGNTIRNSQ